MQDAKQKGQQRLQQFNSKLEHVKQAEFKSKQLAKQAVQSQPGPKVDEIDKVLDKEISQALNGIQGVLTTMYKKWIDNPSEITNQSLCLNNIRIYTDGVKAVEFRVHPCKPSPF